MDLNEKKSKLLNEFIEMAKGRDSSEILPLILAVSQKAKKMGITFTKEETLQFIEKLKGSISEEEQKKIDMLINLMF